MDIQQIKYFLTLAKYRNFTKAARYLHISQSALSRQILDLEQDVRTELFNRTSRSVTLSAAGEVFLIEAQKLMKHYDQMITMTREAGQGKSGRLRIGSLDTINDRIMRLIKMFRTEYPDVHLTIESYNTTSLTEAVLCGDLDLGFTFLFAVRDFEEITRRVLCREQFCILLSKDSPVAGKPSVTLDDLRTEHIILPQFVHPPFIEHFILDMKAGSISYTDSMESLLLQVASGFGISFVPSFLLERNERYRNICIREMPEDFAAVDVVLAWNRDRVNSAADAFIDLSARVFSEK